MKSSIGSVLLIALIGLCDGLAPRDTPTNPSSRRDALNKLLSGAAAVVGSVAAVEKPAIAIDTPEGVDVDSFLRTGMVQMPMGVSGQAGKARPETGVVLR